MPPYRTPAKTSPFDAACVVDFATITVGAVGGGVSNVAVVLNDANGPPVQQQAAIHAYVSSNADGSTLAGSAPSGGVAIGTNGLAVPLVAGKAFLLVTDTQGRVDLNFTDSGGGHNFYLVLVMPDGGIQVSTVISFP